MRASHQAALLVRASREIGRGAYGPRVWWNALNERLFIFVRQDAPDVSRQPMVHLLDWRVVLMNEHLHLFGLVQETNKLRVTSPVQSLRPEGVAVTLSGRVYQLIGFPGDPNQVHIWAEFRHSDWTDVTEEVEERLDLMK